MSRKYMRKMTEVLYNQKAAFVEEMRKLSFSSGGHRQRFP